MSTPAQASSVNGIEISREEFAERHIFLTANKEYYYSRVNIVIGPNGAGKTRMLNVVRDAHIKAQRFDVLYGYFPGLSPNGNNISSDELPDYSLEEFMESSDVSFNDFFKEIESQYSTLLDAILAPKSKKKDQEYTRFLASVNEFFSAFTGKSVIKRHPSDLSRRRRPSVLMLFVKDPHRTEELPLKQALTEFSPGERILFYMSLFLALRKDPAEGRRQVIILDEPEAHLHPDALINFVTGVDKNFPKADIWIATHSLFLLPLYKFNNIIYLEGSCIVSRNSKLYKKILSGMLGVYGDNAQEFFASLSQWQFCDFLSECFTKPDTVDIADPVDPQVQIFIKAMREKKLHKILDYGGGSGRLGRSVEAASACEWKDVEYHIYDKNPQQVNGIKVIDKLEDSDYDCVVMMNVLHEVEPSAWRRTFFDLYSRIRDGGCLLFVEVSALTNGEYPNEDGYFLLGPGELKELFDLKEDPTTLSIEVEKDGKKHYGYLIPRVVLNKVTEETVNNAIQKLRSCAYDEIKEIRAQDPKEANFRKYAFLLQQHMNAMLYLEKHSGETAKPAVPVPEEKKNVYAGW